MDQIETEHVATCCKKYNFTWNKLLCLAVSSHMKQEVIL
jgi:hypothetical protein